MTQYPTWLVETKLRPNKGPSQRIERAHLNHLVDHEDADVLLIHAPPGYGKTSAMTQMYHRLVDAKRSAAWLSLDEHDQDPLRLFCYLVASLKVAGCDIHYILPRNPQDLASSSVSFLTDTLINALSQSAAPVCIFLDDFHRAENELTSAIIKRLLAGLVHSKVVLAARQRLSKIDAAELRATGRLVEITKDDLHFGADDIAGYFGDQLHVENRADYCKAMAKHTEGWPIALQAIRQLISKGTSASDALAQTSGRSSLLSAYFIEQVFETLSKESQNLLLKTAICERINGDLADAICGTKNAWMLLESLEGSDTFIESSDPERQWYRYHRLFAEFLIERARRDGHIDITASAQRAAQWHRQNGDTIEALHFAIMAEDATLIAETLASLGGWRQAMMGNLSWVQKALACLPQEVVRQYPTVWMADIYAKLKIGAYEAAAQEHQELRSVFSHLIERDRAMRRDVALVDSLIVGYQDQDARLAEMINRLESMTSAASDDDHYFVAMQFNTLSFFHFRLGAFDTAHRYAQDCIASYQKAGSLYGEAFIYFHQCFTFYLEGRLRDAKAVLHQGLDLSATQFGLDSDLYAIGSAYASLLYYESNDLHKAQSYLQIAFPKIEHSDAWTEVYLAAYAAGHMCAVAREDWADVAQLKASAFALSQKRNLARVGGFSQVLADSEPTHTDIKPSGNHPRSYALNRFDDFQALAALARKLIRSGHNHNALALLSEYTEQAKQAHLYRPFITLALLRAIASRNLGHAENAHHYFNDAVSLALFEEFKRPFIDEGANVIALINSGKRASDQPGHNRLRDRFLGGIVAEIHAMQKTKSAPRSMLSDREVDVLRSLVQGRTNKEISDVLGISRNTVKFHLKNVFEKLNVTTRHDAIRLSLRDNLM